MNSFIRDKELYLEELSDFIGYKLPMKFRDIDGILNTLFSRMVLLKSYREMPSYLDSYGYNDGNERALLNYNGINGSVEYFQEIFEVLDLFKLNGTKKGNRLIIKFANRYFNLSQIKRIEYFALATRTVSVGTRRVNAQWSPQMAQDIVAFHSIDAEEELRRLLAEEMNNAIIEELRNAANS